MHLILTLFIGLAHGQSCEGLFRFAFELNSYQEIHELMEITPDFRPDDDARLQRALYLLRYGRTVDLSEQARHVFANFKAQIWTTIWVPDREVEADDWLFTYDFTERGRLPARRGAKALEYAQRVRWTETGSPEGLPRPSVRFDFGVKGDLRRLSRRDRRLIRQLLADPDQLPEPYRRLRPL